MATVRRRLATATVAAAVLVGVAAPGAPPTGAAPTTADRCYLAALHEVFLGRPASIYDLEAWLDRYEPHGAVRPHAARLLATSDEWLEAVVVGIYAVALEREPDPDGLAFWIARLRAGTRVTTLTAQVYGTDEVWDRGGSTPEGFVADVFPRIMGREPTAADVEYWAGELGHRGPGDVAKRLLGSIENRRTRVTALYEQILGRSPDGAGRDYWAGRLSTLDDVELAVHLAASTEAHARAQTGCEVPPPATSTRLTEGDRSSLTPQVSDDGRYVAFLSRARDLVPNDRIDEITDLFLWDRETDVVTKVTDSAYHIARIDMSADGRHVAFSTSYLPHEPPGPTENVFSWDRVTGAFTRVTDGNSGSSDPKLSADGRFVAFASKATDLVAGTDPNGLTSDIYLWDRTTGTTERITHGERAASPGAIAGDGGAIVFGSDAPPIGGGPVNNRRIYLWHRSDGSFTDVAAGENVTDMADDGDVVFERSNTLRLWDAETGTETIVARGGTSASAADITPDGATIAFGSENDGLVPGDGNGRSDAFVWERATGTVLRLNDRETTSSRPTTSADGRLVVYHGSPRSGPTAWADLHLWDRGS